VDHTYLRIQIIDLSDSCIDITGVDSPAYFYAGQYGLFFKRQVDVGFLGKLFRCSRVAFADQVVHNDKVDVPADKSLVPLSWVIAK